MPWISHLPTPLPSGCQLTSLYNLGASLESVVQALEGMLQNWGVDDAPQTHLSQLRLCHICMHRSIHTSRKILDYLWWSIMDIDVWAKCMYGHHKCTYNAHLCMGSTISEQGYSSWSFVAPLSKGGETSSCHCINPPPPRSPTPAWGTEIINCPRASSRVSRETHFGAHQTVTNTSTCLMVLKAHFTIIACLPPASELAWSLGEEKKAGRGNGCGTSESLPRNQIYTAGQPNLGISLTRPCQGILRTIVLRARASEQ